MMRILYTVITNAFALFIASLVLDGLSFEGGWVAPVVLAFILTVLNYFVKPIMKFLSFPLVFFTGGLFLIVINAVILYLAHYLLTVMDVSGVTMRVDGLLTYLFGAIIFGLANWLIHWFLKE